MAPAKMGNFDHNHNLFKTKSLRSAIMVQTKLKNISKKRTTANWNGYEKLCSFCVNLSQRT